MGEVLSFASQSSVEDAWEVYASMARAQAADIELTHNLIFQQQMIRAHDRWRRLFLAQDRG